MAMTARAGSGWLAVGALAVLGLLLGGCGGGDAPDGSADGETPAETEDVGAKPQFEVPSDEQPPETLRSEDLVVGEGEEAAAGDTVTVHYVGKAWSTGREFDASWDRGAPITFQLGAGEMIPGWDEGVAGMAVGGRRRLVIPPDMAYGDRGAGEAIEPGETLVFVVDLLEVG